MRLLLTNSLIIKQFYSNMKKNFIWIVGLFIGLFAIISCNSEEEEKLPSDKFVEENESPISKFQKQVYNLFGLNKEDYQEFQYFSGITTKDNAIGLSVVKESNSKLVFAIYDSIQSKVIVCDSSAVVPSQIQETYYDETINYKLGGLKPTILRTKNGFVGIASVLYKNDDRISTYKNFAYFINKEKLSRIDSTNIGTTTVSLKNWGEDAIMMVQYFSANGYRNTLFDLEGNTILTFKENDNYNDFDYILYSQTDFVQYKFDYDKLIIDRKEIEDQTSITEKWFRYISYPDGFDSYKLKYTYTKNENILTFHVSGIQKNGETEKFEIKVNIESGKYEIITNKD